MAWFETVERVSRRYTRIIGLIGLAGLLGLSIATVVDVLARWIFNSPLVGLNDTYSLFLALIIASCFPICNSERDAGHITIRFWGRIFGKRVHYVFEAFGCLAMLLYFAVITWQVWVYADQLAETGQLTWVLGWPLSPWWRIVSIIFFLSLPPTLLAVYFFLRLASKRTAQDGDTPSDAFGKGAH